MQKLMVLLFLVFGIAAACTTIIVTPGASEDGSMYVTHSDDNELMDERIVYVPAADWEQGATRPVYCSACALGAFPEYNSYLGTRLVCTDRAAAYNHPDQPQNIALGEIPQVEHTYAYFDGSYGIMNEHQLMIGECTCGSKMMLDPEPGKRIFYSSELSRVALERCTSAKDAVELMGQLIETYGYYGTGETLLVGDPKEAWVFEMCCGTADSTGGLWVARKVPDGEIFVEANEFRIRNIIDDETVFLHSSNLLEECENLGWWNSDQGEFDWLRAVSAGEYNHPYYSLRRVWRVLSLAAPSLDLSPWVEDGYSDYYPFSVTPDHQLATREVMRLHRDHYEGTQFDMTKGIAAGRFGFPYRYYGPQDSAGDIGDPNRHLEGAWERPLSVNYCGFVYVNQGRSWLPDPIGGVTWFGPDKPAETCFVPFYCGVSDLPSRYQVCNTSEFSRDSAWWAFNFVGDWSGIRYNLMHQDIVDLQEEIEVGEISKVAAADSVALEMYRNNGGYTEYITQFSTSNADSVVAKWWNFADRMIVKYDDGYINSPNHMAHELGYPDWWLDHSGWEQGPISYTSHQEN